MSDDSNSAESRLPLADRRLIRSQRLRLTVINAIVLAIIWTLLSGGVYALLVQRTNTASDAQLLAILYQSQRSPVLLFSYDHRPRFHGGHDDDIDTPYIVWARGPHLAVVTSSIMPEVLRTALQSHASLATPRPQLFSLTIEGIPYRIGQRVAADGYVVQVAQDMSGEEDVLDDLVALATIAGIFGVAITIAAGYALGTWTLRPFIAARRRERELLSDVSHELRTPIAVMGTNIELLLRHTDETDANQWRWLSAISAETGRVRRMLDELLQLARLDAGMDQLARGEVSLNALCADLALLYEPVVTQRGLDFSWSPAPTPCLVWGDEERLRQVLFILLDNACKYTDQGYVRLSLRQDSHWTTVAVQDSGHGMPEHFISRATERFARADDARSDRSSSGLGLAIAQRLILAHGGRLQIQSRQGEGTEVRLSFRTLANDE
ncbi:MAG: HAMP domain-containing sensor histidine kinase [Firmicutes bacterium]|nr:HAMP domain-containing sensor histidine kinase [Bacillota bacterium]